MCGGAIISDFIPPSRSNRVTADHLWPNLKKPKSGKHSSPRSLRSRIFDVDDFEADFRDFKDESDVEDEDGFSDIKPFLFSTPNSACSSTRGNGIFTVFKQFLLWLFLCFKFEDSPVE